MARNENDPAYPAILDYLGVLIRWRGFLAKMIFVSTFMMVVYSLVMPKTFSSQALIVPAAPDPALNVYEAFSGSLLGLGFGAGSTELLLMKAILESRTLKENIVRQFNLEEVYEVETIDEAVEVLSGHLTVTLTENNTLKAIFNHQTKWFTFSHEREEPVKRFVQVVALAVVEQLDRLNRQSQGVEARHYREFIEERRKEIALELTSLEDSLGRYQEAYNVTMVDAQLQATYQAAAVLEAEMVRQELDYAIAVAKLGTDNPMIISLKSGLQAAKDAYESSFGGRDNEKRYLMGYDRDLPRLMKEYLRLQRDIMIQSEIYTFITSKYEESKLREARDMPTINILDQPVVPDLRSAPRRSFLVVTTGVLMTVLAILLAFVLDFFRRAKIQYPEKYRSLFPWNAREA